MADIEVSEKAIEDLIIEYAEENDNELNHTGESFQVIERQVKLGNYGIADIVCLSIYPCPGEKKVCVDVKIIELKKGSLDSKAIAQISRYRTGVEVLLGVIFEDDSAEVTITGDIIGSGFNLAEDSCFSADHTEWIDAYEYSIGIEKGLTFRDVSGWKRKEAGDPGHLMGMIEGPLSSCMKHINDAGAE